ncbi:MAG: PAS domain-containing sensor histidine kinase [Rhodospirillales bacterium]
MRERRPRSWPSLTADPETRAAEALTRLEDVTRLVSDLVWETDADLKLSYVSEHAFEVLGFLPLQLEGKTFSELGRFIDEEGDKLDLDLHKPFRDVTFIVDGASGDLHRLLMSGLPFFDLDDGRFSGVRGTARDVTEIHRAERIRSEQEERQKAFVADVAHELRTPLAVLRAKLDTLKDEQAAAVLRNEVDSMTRLVSQMLAFARYELFRPGSDETADLGEVCTAVATHLAPIAIHEQRTIEVLADGPSVVVRGSAPALEQAIRNLVENAIRFAPPQSTVTVRVTDEPAIHVIDRGPGVPGERRATIFDRFDRADRRGDGAGLGLAIVKRIADAHGAQVEIHDPPEGGADFCMRFPAE